MNTPSPVIRDLARRLTALEAARDPSDGPSGAVVRVCEKLRVMLVMLVGGIGFRSLLSRALTMAKAEVPSLDAVRLRADGSPEGLDGVGSTQAAEDGVVVVAQLIGLLVTFVGEPLTLHLVRDAWPGAPVVETVRTGEERP